MIIKFGDKTFRPSQIEKCVAWLAEEMKFAVEMRRGVALYTCSLIASNYVVVASGTGSTLFEALAAAVDDYRGQKGGEE